MGTEEAATEQADAARGPARRSSAFRRYVEDRIHAVGMNNNWDATNLLVRIVDEIEATQRLVAKVAHVAEQAALAAWADGASPSPPTDLSSDDHVRLRSWREGL